MDNSDSSVANGYLDQMISSVESGIPMELDLTGHGPPPEDGEESKIETFAEKVQRYMKITLPHVGLVLLLGTYTVCGAGIFHIIELPFEVKVRNQTLEKLFSVRREFLEHMWNLTTTQTMAQEDWILEAIRSIDELQSEYFKAFENRYIEITDLRGNTELMWTFPKSIFFSTTVITTIGYGHMVPHTTEGRVFCIVFGLFGIPLLLVTIADIGKFLSDLITLIYRSYSMFKKKVRRRSRRLSSWTRRRASSLSGSVGSSTVPAPVVEPSHHDGTESESDNDEIMIPVWMVILFLTCYTALGGVLFKVWEGWSYFDAFYFCFITMSTIGFGDIVPTRQMFMFLTVVYIVIGLAIATMCIDLAGTEYIRKIHYFGQKIETAKHAVAAGLHYGGEYMSKVRTTGGKFINVSDLLMWNMQRLQILRRRGVLPPDFNLSGIALEHYFNLHPDIRNRAEALENILWEPLSDDVRKVLKPHIKVLPNEIAESDAYILENKVFDKPVFQRWRAIQAQMAAMTASILSNSQQSQTTSSGDAMVQSKAGSWPTKKDSAPIPILIAPFILKETDV